MNKIDWKNRIKKACEEAETYQSYFEDAINTLASIMERRDLIEEQYEADGSQAVIIHVNKAGEPNLTKNPLLVLLNELNKDALSYWRDLGLTPAGYKKITDKLAGGGIKTFSDL